MELVINQFYTFTVMFIFGIVMGAGFDIYRHMASNIKNRALLNIMDLLSGVIAGVVAFCVLIYANWGVFRFYIIIAIFLGIIIYFKIISKLIPGK